MITSIHVKNFTIINEIELDLFSDMTVLTGETGAGKSIIVDTLDIALGGRSDSSLIRHDKDSAEITVSFDIAAAEEVKNWLAQNEFLSDNECIIRRVLRQDGHSKILINGSNATRQAVHELGSFLVNIHGQHESQNLLKPEKQMAMLDNFAGNDVLVKAMRQYYFAWLDTKKKFDDLLALAVNHDDKLEFINYQLKELSDLALENDEIEKLHHEHSCLSNAESLIACGNLALDLTRDNETGNVLHYLNYAKNTLAEIKMEDPKILSILTLLNNAIINAEEASLELSTYINSIELNQENLITIEKRLNTIYDIARKHKVKPEELPAIKLKLQDEAESLMSLEQNLQQIKTEITAIETKYQQIARDLSAKRKEAGARLEQLVTEKMQILGMAGGKFALNFVYHDDNAIKINGLESLEFMVSANPGMPLQSLRKVASGGELSRISLALQVIAMNKSRMPVLIFDEVDVGIGGKTAEIVGKLLKSLAVATQVLCVTHLPQVAMQGKQHLKIEKITDGNTTEAVIINLNKKMRVEEIARMLGGINISAKTLATAREMLNG